MSATSIVTATTEDMAGRMLILWLAGRLEDIGTAVPHAWWHEVS